MDEMREKMEKIENNTRITQNKGKENRIQKQKEERKERRIQLDSPTPGPSKRAKEPDRIVRMDDSVADRKIGM